MKIIDAKNIKLIAVDVDNTILPAGNTKISQGLKEAFQLANAQGIHVMVNTGRHYSFIYPSFFEDIPMSYIGTINGACLVDRDGKVISKHPLNDASFQKLTQLRIQNDIGLGYKFEDHVVTYNNHEKYINGYLPENSPLRKIVIDDTKDRNHHKIYGNPLGTFLIGDEKVIQEMSKEFSELTFAYSFIHGFDVLNKDYKARC